MAPRRAYLSWEAALAGGAGAEHETERCGDDGIMARELASLRLEEQHQTKVDSFWGLDLQTKHQLDAREQMVVEDRLSRACVDQLKVEQQHEAWAKLHEEEQQRERLEEDDKEETARRAYMKFFHASESSDEIMDYIWPTQPSLNIIFGSVPRKDVWSLQKSLNTASSSVFHSSSSLTRHDVDEVHLDQFVTTMQSHRTEARKPVSFSLTKKQAEQARSKSTGKVHHNAQQPPALRPLAQAGSGMAHDDARVIDPSPSLADLGFGGGGFLERPCSEPGTPLQVKRDAQGLEEESWRALYSASDQGSIGKVPPSALLDALARPENSSIASNCRTFQLLHDHDAFRHALLGLRPEDGAGLTMIEWTEFCETIQDIGTWNDI